MSGTRSSTRSPVPTRACAGSVERPIDEGDQGLVGVGGNMNGTQKALGAAGVVGGVREVMYQTAPGSFGSLRVRDGAVEVSYLAGWVELRYDGNGTDGSALTVGGLGCYDVTEGGYHNVFGYVYGRAGAGTRVAVRLYGTGLRESLWESVMDGTEVAGSVVAKRLDEFEVVGAGGPVNLRCVGAVRVVITLSGTVSPTKAGAVRAGVCGDRDGLGEWVAGAGRSRGRGVGVRRGVRRCW